MASQTQQYMQLYKVGAPEVQHPLIEGSSLGVCTWTKQCKSKNGRKDKGIRENLEMGVHHGKGDEGSMWR